MPTTQCDRSGILTAPVVICLESLPINPKWGAVALSSVAAKASARHTLAEWMGYQEHGGLRRTALRIFGGWIVAMVAVTLFVWSHC